MQLDIISAEEYGANGCPHASWARLRREAPVAWFEQDGFDPFWAITRHADVIWVSRQPDAFLNGPRMAMLHNSVRPPEAVRKNPAFRPMIRTLLNMDNPDHRAPRHAGRTGGSGSPTCPRVPPLDRAIQSIV